MRIKSYYFPFDIIIKHGEIGYLAYAPEVGGVYEEGATIEEAISNAHASACAIIEIRLQNGDSVKAGCKTGGGAWLCQLSK